MDAGAGKGRRWSLLDAIVLIAATAGAIVLVGMVSWLVFNENFSAMRIAGYGLLLLGIAGPPHGTGVMIGGSTTVMVNNLPAGRVGDMIQEIMSPAPNSCAVGLPTVIIGG